MLLLKFRRFLLGRLPYAAWALVYFCLCGLVPSTLAQTSTGVGKPEQTKNTNHVVESTWTDTTTGLIWTKKDNGSDVNWSQASDYCTKLQLAGYNDWRLPTIEELEGIYDPSISAQAALYPSEDASVHVKGNLMLTGWDWSSPQEQYPRSLRPGGRFFHFDQTVEHESSRAPLVFSDGMRALCVRRSGE